MHGHIVARAKSSFKVAFWVLVLSALCSVGVVTQKASMQNGSVIGATVCLPSSTITLDTPASDSVVTDAAIEISGSVMQASQVEVKINDAFNSIIQLSIGQTNYSSTIQLTPGTHTIEVSAVNVCPGSTGTASSVVTYEPPPSEPSAGGDTGTNINGDQAEGVAIGADGSVSDAPNNLGLFGAALVPLQDLAKWLNLSTGDIGEENIATMSLTRAVTFTGGLYLVVIGVAPGILQAAASLPAVATAVPAPTLPGRIRFLSVFGRVAGIVMIVGSLFLP